MATYGEVPVSIATGSLTSTGTLYTCPAGKYARVTVACDSTGGASKVTHNGAVVALSGTTNASNTWYLASGEALLFNNGTGGAPRAASYTAIEYPNPS